jgi:hypothetical protein
MGWTSPKQPMFARKFLTELARKYELSPDQETAFVALQHFR